MRKVIKNIWNITTWIIVAFVVIMAIALAGTRFVGYIPYAVLSPSMTPIYQVGDLVYVKAIEPETIEIGDAITFVANEELLVVTHRVTETDRENRCFITKGDANNVEDAAPVLYENVLGVVAFSLPKLGYISMYLSTESGKYVGIAVVLTMILLFILPEVFKQDKKKDNSEN